MTKEEAPPRVMRIGVGLRVGVVRPVVAAPLVEVVLQGEHVTEGEEEAQRGGGPKRSMRPEAVGAQLNAQRRRLEEEHGEKEGTKSDLRVEQQPSKGEQVKGGHQEDISPDNFNLHNNSAFETKSWDLAVRLSLPSLALGCQGSTVVAGETVPCPGLRSLT
ncbi:hypothetical protein TYRP_005219 [Tyrophagus putrescentiae]|nr:hypothetical protein TYRP_005219 [Tyrophagus putrescentiae]